MYAGNSWCVQNLSNLQNGRIRTMAIPSCCSRVILEIRPYCSRGLPYYSLQLYYILQYSRKVFTYVFHANVNRARARVRTVCTVRYHKSTTGPFVDSPCGAARRAPAGL